MKNIFKENDGRIYIKRGFKKVWYDPSVPSKKYNVLYLPNSIKNMTGYRECITHYMDNGPIISIYKGYMLIIMDNTSEYYEKWEIEVLSQIIPKIGKGEYIQWSHCIYSYNPDIMYSIWKDKQEAQIVLLGINSILIIKDSSVILYEEVEKSEDDFTFFEMERRVLC